MTEAGGTLNGFRIERERLGAGLVKTYEATQLSIDQPAVLELLEPDTPSELEQQALLEASISARLPGMLEMLDSGTSDRGAFRAVRAPTGPTLGEALGDGLDSDQTRTLAGSLANTLDALHEAGIPHRDVRPHTVFMLADGTVQLAPPALPPAVGKSTTIEAADPRDFAYLAPEILGGAEPSKEGDIYALAATLFHALTGQPPFATAEAAIAAAAKGNAASAKAVRTELSGAVDSALAHGLAGDPTRRPATAGELVREVATALAGATLPAPGVPVKQPRSRRRLALAAVGVGAAALAAAAAIALIGDETETQAGVPPVPEGAVPLGSDLMGPAEEIETLNCGGKPKRDKLMNCSLLQTDLPGATLVAPEDGSIKGWAVRGGKGLVQLQVFRPSGDGYFHHFVTQSEHMPDAGIHYFPANTGIQAGDVVGVLLFGGRIGARKTEGATTSRWLPPQYGAPARAPDFESGTGFDHELMVRVDYVPGEPPEPAEQLDGAEAEAAPDGEKIESKPVVLSDDTKARLEVTRVSDQTFLDLVVDGVRTSRRELTGVDPEGHLHDLSASPVSEDRIEIGFRWDNPGSHRFLYHEHYPEIVGRTFAPGVI